MIEPFKEENFGTVCCGAKLHDPGNTGEGLCSECGEYSNNQIMREFDLAFLDFTNGEVHIVRLEYLQGVQEDPEEAIQDFFDEHGIDSANCEYMFSEDRPIVAKDHRKSVEKKEE